MIADPHRMPVSHAPGIPRRHHGAVQALDRLVLRELEQVAVRGPRTPSVAPEDEHDPVAAPTGADHASEGSDAAAATPAPALDASATRFVERAVAWLARRDDASAVLEALARAVAPPPAPAEQATSDDMPAA